MRVHTVFYTLNDKVNTVYMNQTMKTLTKRIHPELPFIPINCLVVSLCVSIEPNSQDLSVCVCICVLACVIILTCSA